MRRTRVLCSSSKAIGLLIILICHVTSFSVRAQNSIADSSRIKVFPLSKLNTKEAEYSPFKFKDKFYFVSDRENDFAVIYYDQTTNHQFSDLYRATMKDTLKFKKIISISAKIEDSAFLPQMHSDKTQIFDANCRGKRGMTGLEPGISSFGLPQQLNWLH